ncbi:uncharacterized protein LOC102077137 [Xyrichtys novacula]|uniref:Uncharacterized protein LOC102077137 n=1 Tax=Xyrichtys novacula TaxID=13765 RepID=A0AAV1FUK9_XYRNO|nr:uncharacterized protein LOC102077137 [Xyrichtys novacula]
MVIGSAACKRVSPAWVKKERTTKWIPLSQRQSESEMMMWRWPSLHLKRKREDASTELKWEADFKWLESVQGDPFKANCTVCRRQFIVSHGGFSDIRQHAAGENHKRLVKQKRSQGALTQFLVPQATPETNKVYGHFSISAKRRENLKDFCEFCDIEFHDILRHVVTRWLSLNPAISCLLENWPALKSYFMSIKDCPKRLRELLSNVLSLFEEVVKKLERDNTVSVDLYAIMDSFLQRLTQRREDKYYGYLTRKKRQLLSPDDARLATGEFTTFLNTAIYHVEKWFNFSQENGLFHLQPLGLTSGKISYEEMEKITEKLHLAGRLNLSMDKLYDECVTANSILDHLKRRLDWKSKGTAEKWMEVIRGQAAELPNLLVVLSFVLSILSSTGKKCLWGPQKFVMSKWGHGSQKVGKPCRKPLEDQKHPREEEDFPVLRRPEEKTTIEQETSKEPQEPSAPEETQLTTAPEEPQPAAEIPQSELVEKIQLPLQVQQITSQLENP